MTSLQPRNAVPAAILLSATFFLGAAVPSARVDAQASAGLPRPSDVGATDLQQCLERGRERAACVEEAEGKALIRRAEWSAALQGQAEPDAWGGERDAPDTEFAPASRRP